MPEPLLRPLRDLLEPPAGRYTDRQEQILADLERVFARRGLRAVTIGDLTAELRCSRRTLYALAPTKEELFRLVIDRMFRRLGEHAADVLSLDLTVEEQIERLVCDSISILRPGGANFALELEEFPSVRQVFLDHVEAANQVIASVIAVGVRQGRLRSVDSRLMAGALRAMVTYAASDNARRPVGMTEIEAVREVTHAMLWGLRQSAL